MTHSNNYKENKKMKEWIATYTDDYGQTEKTITAQAETYTMAYLAVAIKLDNTNGIITGLKEA